VPALILEALNGRVVLTVLPLSVTDEFVMVVELLAFVIVFVVRPLIPPPLMVLHPHAWVVVL
jgi:hypothetical protein